MQVLSTREDRMQIITYNWVSFIHNIFKKENKKGDNKFSAHEAYLE